MVPIVAQWCAAFMPDSRPRPDSPDPSDPRNSESDKLATLGERLKRLRTATAPPPSRGPAVGRSATPLSMALRVGVEMVAGVAVGLGFGYVLDHWLGTKPFMFIVFFFLGAGAGALNTYRAIMRAGFGQPAESQSGTQDEDSDRR